jgi:CheY-like chemotaxis protein
MSADDPILLVEDNPDDVVFMKRAIRQAGILQPFSIAEHGQDAIDYLSRSGRYVDQASSPVPRLIFLDLKLPYKSGLEVLQWIRAHDSLKTIPVIILTTSAEASDVERAYCLGANAYLVKPANMSELTNILKAFKAFWVDYNLFPERTR